MAQFDYYPQRRAKGYWLDCQTVLLSDIESRFVAPLLPIEVVMVPIRQLNPVFEIAGSSFVLLTQQAGPAPAADLGKPAGSLADFRYEILTAFDFLITGV